MSTPRPRSSAPRFTRRAALRGAALGTLGIVGAALIGCNSGDGESTTEPTPTPSSTSTPPTASAASASATPTPPPFTRGGTWNVAFETSPPTLDPYGTNNTDTKAIAAYSYQRLYKRGTFPGSDGGITVPTPDLSLSAETEDGATWTLKLRDAKFHNISPVEGRAVTSDDVLFSTDRLRATESPNSPEVDNWIKVEAPDESTVVVTLDRPSAIFLEQLADTNLLQILPREADGGFDPASRMIGSGPWIHRDSEDPEQFGFDANPAYYELGEDGNPLPYLDAATIAVIPEYPRRLAQFLAGELSALRINPLDVIDTHRFDPQYQWFGQASQITSILYWSNTLTTESPWVDDRFRQAISRSLDRDALTNHGYNTNELGDAGLPVRLAWNNIIPAGWGSRWWLDPQGADQGPSATFFEYNLAEAIKLLAAAGVEETLRIPYLYTGRYGGAFPLVAEAQTNMIQQLGLDPIPDVQDYETEYLPRTFRGDFEGMAFGYETVFPEAGAYFNRYFGDDPANHSKIRDSRMDEIIAQQAVALDEDERRQLFHEAQVLNAEHMWYVPSQAGAGTSYTGYQGNVRGGIRDTLGYGAGTEEYIWYWYAPQQPA